MGLQLFLQHVSRPQEDIDHVALERQLVVADTVQQGLQDVGHPGHVGEAEGGAAPLDGVGGAKNGVELLLVRGFDVQGEKQVFHVGQVLRGFFEEHLVELAHVDGHSGALNGCCG